MNERYDGRTGKLFFLYFYDISELKLELSKDYGSLPLSVSKVLYNLCKGTYE